MCLGVCYLIIILAVSLLFKGTSTITLQGLIVVNLRGDQLVEELYRFLTEAQHELSLLRMILLFVCVSIKNILNENQREFNLDLLHCV